jgi:hypothetical protein
MNKFKFIFNIYIYLRSLLSYSFLYRAFTTLFSIC